MWWDWNQITLQDSVLFILVSTLLLYFVGSGILRLTCILIKKSNPLESLGFFQRLNAEIFFGFAFLFQLALIFSVFKIPLVESFLIIISFAAAGFVASFYKSKFKLTNIPKFNLRKYSISIIITIILFSIVIVSSLLITGLYGSTNDDGADHTWIMRIILDNPTSLITHTAQPYSNNILDYPFGAHVLSSFLLVLLQIPIQKAIIMVCAILPALIALSLYSTTKLIFENKILSILVLIVTAFFTFSLSFGPLGWAGLPVLLSIYITASGIGLIFPLLQKPTLISAALLGTIFFISLETYPSALLLLSLWLFLTICFMLLKKVRSKLSKATLISFVRRHAAAVAAFLAPLSLGIPYVYTVFSNNAEAINAFISQGLPFNPSAEIVKVRIGFNWLVDIPALTNFFSAFSLIFWLAPFSLFVLLLLSIPAVSKKLLIPNKFVLGLWLVFLFMLLIMTYLTLTIYLQINLLSNLFDPLRLWYHIYIIGTIFTAVVLFFVIHLSYLVFKRLLSKSEGIRLPNKNKLVSLVLAAALVLCTFVFLPSLIEEQKSAYQSIGSSFTTYSSLNNDDLRLMQWIKNNVDSQQLILISAGDSGQYVTSITQRQTVSLSNRLANYSSLMMLLTDNASDLSAIPLLIQYNISYVYIGSTHTKYALQYSWYRPFNVTQFLLTPYFETAKVIGNAWLFQFNASSALDYYDFSINKELNSR